MKKPSKQHKFIHLSLSDSIHSRLMEMSKYESIPMSYIVRIAVNDYYKQYLKKIYGYKGANYFEEQKIKEEKELRFKEIIETLRTGSLKDGYKILIDLEFFALDAPANFNPDIIIKNRLVDDWGGVASMRGWRVINESASTGEVSFKDDRANIEEIINRLKKDKKI